jgi:hypothetical protein
MSIMLLVSQYILLLYAYGSKDYSVRATHVTPCGTAWHGILWPTFGVTAESYNVRGGGRRTIQKCLVFEFADDVVTLKYLLKRLPGRESFYLSESLERKSPALSERSE